MIKVMIAIGLLFHFLLGFSTAASEGKPESEMGPSEVPTVSLCELVRDSRTYDQKRVRLKAIYAVNFEWVLLYDCKCEKKNSYIYPIIAGDTDEASRSMEDAIAKNLKYGRNSGDRVGLVMTGVFLAPQAHQPGHESGNDWPKFKIIRIEKMTEIPEAAPPPGECSTGKR